MAEPSVASKAVELATSRWGRLDGVIVNHGTLEPVKKVADGTVEEWRKAFDTNVFSAVGLVSSGVFFLVFLFLFVVVVFLFSSLISSMWLTMAFHTHFHENLWIISSYSSTRIMETTFT
jgi:NAD(P)-dependent dehydrogenase (short-subunit alcohol dehydrogenase family)